MPTTVLERFRLNDQVALVTGAGRGIGRVCALALAEAGADIAALDLDPDTAAETEEAVRALGQRAISIGCDVTRSSEVNKAVEQVVARLGRLDIVLANAGVCVHAPAEDMTDEQWNHVVRVDLDAVFFTARAAGRAMIAAGRGGRIVATASMSARIVNHPQCQCAYNAAKAGVVQLVRSLACEWAPHNITVNSISPGYTGTEMTLVVKDLHAGWKAETPMQRLAKPEEISPAVVFLASPGASFITGHDLVIDGGFTCW